MLRGFLIPIIDTIFIELSSTAYLFLFFPRLILRLNLLPHLSKSDRNQTFSTRRLRYIGRLHFPFV
jgi:hypothetical protein